MKFEDAAADRINDYKVNSRKSTDDVQCRIDKGLAPWFKGRRLTSITTSDVRASIAHRQAANARSSRASWTA